MKRISLGQPVPGREQEWFTQSLREIEAATAQETAAIADAYTLGDFVVTRSLDPATATVTDVANVLATLLYDLQRRGTNRAPD